MGLPPKRVSSVVKIENLHWVPVGHLSYIGGILTPNRNGLATSYFKASLAFGSPIQDDRLKNANEALEYYQRKI